MDKAANESKVGIVGLGYVGLPLAVAFGKRFDDGRMRHIFSHAATDIGQAIKLRPP